jgi:phosphatidate cytidylyltransferase
MDLLFDRRQQVGAPWFAGNRAGYTFLTAIYFGAMFPSLETGIHVGIAMALLYSLLAAASLSVKLASRGAPPSMLSNQVNAWWRIFPIVSIVLLTYPLGPAMLAYLVFLLAVLELAPHYPGPQRQVWFGSMVVVLSASFLYWLGQIMSATVLLGAILIQVLRLCRRPHAGAIIWLLVLVIAGTMAVLAAFASLPFGPDVNLAWLLYLFTLTALNDIGQFVAGKLFGRNKIAPTISPNKTWQGLTGGLIISQLASHVLGAYLALGSPARLAMYAVLLSLGGLTGDLMFSAAKRYLSIKDFSQLIPGHGGILDRVDSLVVTAPLLYCLLSISG